MEGKSVAMTAFRIQELESLFRMGSASASQPEEPSKSTAIAIPRSYRKWKHQAGYGSQTKGTIQVHLAGSTSSLTTFQQLESLGFEWVNPDSTRPFERACRLSHDPRHCNIPQNQRKQTG
jgi:hypothetical protein